MTMISVLIFEFLGFSHESISQPDYCDPIELVEIHVVVEPGRHLLLPFRFSANGMIGSGGFYSKGNVCCRNQEIRSGVSPVKRKFILAEDCVKINFPKARVEGGLELFYK